MFCGLCQSFSARLSGTNVNRLALRNALRNVYETRRNFHSIQTPLHHRSMLSNLSHQKKPVFRFRDPEG